MSNLIERAKNIILTPRAEWERIAPEPANTGAILTGYVLPLALISAAASAIGGVMFGYGFGPFKVSVGLVPAVVTGAVQVVLAMAWVFVMGLIINALAPNFGSTQNSGQALKLAAYSATASLLAGVFAIYPPLGALSILGLYSIVLMYIGMPRLMGTPDDKRVGYIVTIIIVGIVVAIVIGVVLGAVRTAIPGGGPMGGMHFGASAPASSDTRVKFGDTEINVGDMEKQAKALEQAFSQGGQGAAAQVDPSALQALLPASLPGGFNRTAVRSSTGGAMGMGASQAEATYENGDARIELTIVHLGAMGGLASMAAAAGVQANEQTEDGFSRTRSEGGRVYNESMSRSSGTVSYAVIGKNGATLNVEGSGGVTPEQAVAALETVGIARIEALGAK